MFFKSFWKSSTRFCNIFIFTVHPTTLFPNFKTCLFPVTHQSDPSPEEAELPSKTQAMIYLCIQSKKLYHAQKKDSSVMAVINGNIGLVSQASPGKNIWLYAMVVILIGSVLNVEQFPGINLVIIYLALATCWQHSSVWPICSTQPTNPVIWNWNEHLCCQLHHHWYLCNWHHCYWYLYHWQHCCSYFHCWHNCCQHLHHQNLCCQHLQQFWLFHALTKIFEALEMLTWMISLTFSTKLSFLLRILLMKICHTVSFLLMNY